MCDGAFACMDLGMYLRAQPKRRGKVRTCFASPRLASPRLPWPPRVGSLDASGRGFTVKSSWRNPVSPARSHSLAPSPDSILRDRNPQNPTGSGKQNVMLACEEMRKEEMKRCDE